MMNNLDDIYVNDEDSKCPSYNYDNDFIFKEIADNIFGSKDPSMRIDSIDLSIETTEDNYIMIECKNDFRIVENYFDIVNKNPKDIENMQNNSYNTDTHNDPKINSQNNFENINTQDDSKINSQNDSEKYENISTHNNSKINSRNDSEKSEDSNSEKINKELKRIKSSNFFECFDENISINNSIACNNLQNNKELTASYMFEAEDLREVNDDLLDIIPYEDEDKKPKNDLIGKFTVIIVSTFMLLGGSKIFPPFAVS